MYNRVAFYQEATMSKLVVLPSLVWAIAALLGASRAEATIAAPQSGSEVEISDEFQSIALPPICGYSFYYLQRMTVGDGPSRLVATDQVYRPGHYQLVLFTTCDGYEIYGVGDCGC
jgi:hypothetical protein